MAKKQPCYYVQYISWTILCTSASLKVPPTSMQALSDFMCCRLPIDDHPQHSLRDREGPQHHISTCKESSPHHFSACREGPLHQLSACGENLCRSDPRKVHFSAISIQAEILCRSSPKKSALLGFHSRHT